MSVFKRRRFPAEIILLCVRWYCRYGISYRDLEEMMDERGVAVEPRCSGSLAPAKNTTAKVSARCLENEVFETPNVLSEVERNRETIWVMCSAVEY